MTAGGRAALLAALPLFLMARIAVSSSLDVSPVRLQFEAGQRSHVVTIRNIGDSEMSIQADPVDWRQVAGGTDRYEPSAAMLVVPRIFTVAAGEAQIVRIGRISTDAPAVEGAYRVFFTELAPPAGHVQGAGLSMRLRVGIPAFVTPAGPADPRLELLASRPTPEGIEVVLENQGNVHIQVLAVRGQVIGHDQPDMIQAQASGYLLPGTTRSFLLPAGPGATVSSLTVETDTAGTVEYGLPFGD